MRSKFSKTLWLRNLDAWTSYSPSSRRRTPRAAAPQPRGHGRPQPRLRGLPCAPPRSSRRSYSWRLSNHLLPFFAEHRLSQITAQEVDRYRTAKVREGELSARSINMTLTLLAAVLEQAVDYELLERQPCEGQEPPRA